MNPVCYQCNHEMVCTKNGVIIECTQFHCYSGDKFTCGHCGKSVIVNIGQPFTISMDNLDSKVEVIKLEQ
jgi:hypothetical protein